MATALPLLLSKNKYLRTKYIQYMCFETSEGCSGVGGYPPGFYSARSAFLIQVLPEEAHGYITQSEIELSNPRVRWCAPSGLLFYPSTMAIAQDR